MRLIDADALRDKRQFVEVTDGSWRTTACVVLATDIDQAPTIEAEPVMHGRWIEKDDGVMHCTECDRVGNPHIDNYCPNCGANMKGGGDK